MSGGSGSRSGGRGGSGKGGGRRSGGSGKGSGGRPGGGGNSGGQRRNTRGAGGSGGGSKATGGGRAPARSGGRSAGGGSAGGRSGGRGRGKSGGSGGPSGGKRPTGLDGTQVEGRQAVRELLLAGRRRVREVFIGSDVDRVDVVQDIVALAAEVHVPLREVSRSKIDHMSRTDAPQGVIAFAEQVPGAQLSEMCDASSGPPFLLALDGVTDPGNLGALLRIADGAGVTGVVIPRHRAARITPTVAKAAVGAVEYLPMTLVGGLPAAIEEMRAAGIWVVGLDAGGERPVHDLELASEGVCLVLGAEGPGLSRLVRERCDLIASIPLRGHLDSLNVASAGAVACFEVARHRA